MTEQGVPVFLTQNRFIAVVMLGLGLAPAVAAGQSDIATEMRQRQLVHLVRQDCGSCHGLTLQGGLGPALTPMALASKPAEGLVATILGGRPGTPMPPFKGMLSEAEAAWIVERLMAGFPADPGALPDTQR